MTYIIAEAGVNHSGRLDTAIELIATAKSCGADAVKFQAFNPFIVAPGDYTRQALLKGLTLSKQELIICAAESKKLGIDFLCTPMDEEWLAFLTKEMAPDLRPRRIKIGSGQSRDAKFVAACAATGLPLIMSFGMSTHEQRDAAIEAARGCDVTLLHCLSRYPTPEHEITMKAVRDLAARYGKPVGFSSHCPSFWPSVCAVHAGAVMIEQHIMLPGCKSPDAESSLLPEQFVALVREVRDAA